ncbi:MAG TPA: hypothetical protein VGK67_16705 [Myxococcales bacterium]|jgi:hypothetical protein
MTGGWRRAVAGLLLVSGLCLGSGAARAAVVLPLSVEELAHRADTVVRGTALGTRSVRSADGKQIHSVTTVRVDLALKGAPPIEVDVLSPGGTWGRITQSVAGAPRFVPGERVILFLRSAGTRRFRVEGLSLGKFEVWADERGTAQVTQRAEGIQIAGPDGSVRPAPPVGPIPEQDFLARVRAALRRERQ